MSLEISNHLRYKLELFASNFYRYKIGIDYNCRIGKIYPAPKCIPGEPCAPIEGHFITECENCENF